MTRIFVTSASPDYLNQNAVLREFVAEGCRDVVGKINVAVHPLERAPEQIRQFKPGLVIVFGSIMPDASDFTLLKKAADDCGAKVAFWLHDDPYEFDHHSKCLPFADFVFSNDRFAALHYDHGPAHHLPLAASPTHHLRPVDSPKDIDIFFCGEAFSNRIRLFKDLSTVLSRYKTVVLGNSWPSNLHFAQNRRLDNLANTDHYAKSKIVINVGRQHDLANRRYFLTPSTPGPRTFEAAMAGALQFYFVGDGLEITDYFTPDREIVLFDSVSQFSALLPRHLANPEFIGKAAQERCLKEHTYSRRIQKMLEVIGI
jgi:spore maturation protein CgeB